MTRDQSADWRPWGPRPSIVPGLRGSIARGSALSVAGLIAQGALRFLTSWLVGTIAGRESLGQIATAISTATLLSLLWPTSAGAAMSKFVARALGAGDLEGARSLTWHIGVTTAIAVAIGAVVALPAWRIIAHGTMLEGLAVSALAIGFGGYALARGGLFALGLVPRAAASDLLSAFVGMLGLVVALAAGVRGVALILPLALANFLYVLLSWPRGAVFGPQAVGRPEVTRFIALTTVGTVASTGFLQLSQVVVRSTQGARGAGGYAAALTLATPASLLVTALSLVLLPSLAESLGRGDRKNFLSQADSAMRGITTVMVGVLGSIVILGGVLTSAVWGSDYAEVADLLPVLALAILVTNLGVASVSSLNVSSERGVVLTTGASLFGMVVGCVVWTSTAREGGPVAVAAGYLCGVIVLAGIPVAVVIKRYGQRWGVLLLKVLLAVFSVGAVVAMEDWVDTSAWVEVVAAVTFAAVWFSAQKKDLGSVISALKKRP